MKSITDEFPLQVLFPNAGDVYLLQWYEYNEGNNVIVARSIENAVLMFKHAEERHTGIKPVKFFKATIVSPSDSMKVFYAAKKYNDAMMSFKYMIDSVVGDYMEEFKEPPPGYARCPEYKPDPERVSTPEDLEYNSPGHGYCLTKDCVGGAIIRNVEALFWPYHDRKKAEDAARKAKRPKHARSFDAQPSKAAPPVEGKALYVADANFGHHSKGLSLEPFDGECGPEVSFFFQGEELPIPEPITAFVAGLEAEHAAKKIADEEAFQTRAKERIITMKRDTHLLLGVPNV